MLGAHGEQKATCPSHGGHQATNQESDHGPSLASRSLPKGVSGRTEAGAALLGASHRRAGGRAMEGGCNKHHCRLAELGIIVAKPLRTC